jgi:hypothetical protein
VVVWILLGAVWVMVNPAKRGHRLTDTSMPQHQVASL